MTILQKCVYCIRMPNKVCIFHRTVSMVHLILNMIPFDTAFYLAVDREQTGDHWRVLGNEISALVSMTGNS